MEAKDFRVGNLIEAKIKDSYDSVERWTKIKITGIEYNDGFNQEPNKLYFIEPDISTFNHFRRFTKLDDNCLTPIPLTEEILLKCGFEKYEGQEKELRYWIFIEKKDVCIISDGQTVYSNICPYKKLVNMMQIKNAKYLHELQNLFYYLIGKELEINL